MLINDYLSSNIIIYILQRLRHENLINLIEVFRKRRKLYLVFEYVDHTVLEELEDHPKGLPPDTARSHVFQVLRGIEFCHQNNVRIIQLFSNYDYSGHACKVEIEIGCVLIIQQKF